MYHIIFEIVLYNKILSVCDLINILILNKYFYNNNLLISLLINPVIGYSTTFIHSIIISKNINRLQQTIKLGADLNIKDKEGMTPLVITCQNLNNKSFTIIKLVLENNCDVYARSYLGLTALHFKKKPSEDIIMILRKYDADINESDIYGRTPLHYASIYKYNNELYVKYFENLNINSKDKSGKTPLHYAFLTKYKNESFSNYLLNIERILKIKPDIYIYDYNGNTPFDYEITCWCNPIKNIKSSHCEICINYFIELKRKYI